MVEASDRPTDRQNAKSPQIVSDQILWLRRDRQMTTPMHVLKLVYLCHGWLLGSSNRILIYEPVEAWRYGPVVPSVYHVYKQFGGGNIDIEHVDRSSEFDQDQLEVFSFVDEVYGHLNAVQLSALTHRPGTPWDVTVRHYGYGHSIPNTLIRDHFETHQ